MEMFVYLWRLRNLFYIFLVISSITLITVILHLSVVNYVNRVGAEEYDTLVSEIEMLRDDIRQLEYDIATASALERVEKRAEELGFTEEYETVIIR